MDAVVPPCAPRLCGMPDLARSFDDVAAAYELGRPRYERHAIDAIAAAAGGQENPTKPVVMTDVSVSQP